MTQLRQPKTLDDLLARAAHYAEFAMRRSGRVAPTLLVLTPDGLLFFVPESMDDNRAKDNFANAARFICVAHAATEVVMILESWMRVAAPGEALDPAEAPSEAIDRKEVVVLAGESRQKPVQKFLPIIRTDVGSFFGFGDSNVPEFSNLEGRFAEILPPKPPTKEMRSTARVVLKVMGITDASLRGGPLSYASRYAMNSLCVRTDWSSLSRLLYQWFVW